MQAISQRDWRLLHAWHGEALLHTVADRVDILLELLFLGKIRGEELLDPEIEHAFERLISEVCGRHGTSTRCGPGKGL